MEIHSAIILAQFGPMILLTGVMFYLIKILAKLSSLEDHLKNAPTVIQSLNAPKSPIIEKRKPIVMDDDRAYRLEIDDLATRGQSKF